MLRNRERGKYLIALIQNPLVYDSENYFRSVVSLIIYHRLNVVDL